MLKKAEANKLSVSIAVESNNRFSETAPLNRAQLFVSARQWACCLEILTNSVYSVKGRGAGGFDFKSGSGKLLSF